MNLHLHFTGHLHKLDINAHFFVCGINQDYTSNVFVLKKIRLLFHVVDLLKRLILTSQFI